MMAVSCSEDKSPTAPATPENQAPTAPQAVAGRAKLLTDVPASGPTFTETPASSSTGPVTGTLAATGETITGSFTIQRLHINQTTQKLEADGVFTYRDANQAVHTVPFQNIEATLTRGGAPTAPVCDILTLNLGPLHLDVLGLVIDLDEVNLAITAVSGSGNLLGNLLCAVAGLLDGPGPLAGVLGAIQNLLNQINVILGGL